MKSAFRRLFAALLIVVLIFSVFTLTSCNRRYDEEEVLSVATKLLRNAEMLNEVYYGKGIRYVTSGYIDGSYYEADMMHLASLGFTTVKELRDITLETFTVGYSEQIFSTKLSMIEDETGIQYMTRYYQRYDGLDGSDPVCIMVYSSAPVSLKDEIVYDYSSVRVSGVKKQTVYVTVSATVTNSEGESQKRDIILNLIEEDDGWRIDGPCYTNYSTALDRYEELENNKIK